MTLTAAQRETLDRLLSALRDDELTKSRAAELEQLVLGHEEAMRHYLRVVNLGAGLRWMTEEEGGGRKAEGGGRRAEGGGLGTSVPGNVNDGEWPVDNNTPLGAAVEPPRQSDSEIPGSEPLVPPIVLDLSPTSHYPLATSHFFVGSPVFSYMVATVILGMMLLGAWAYKITHYYQIAEAPTVPSSDRPELEFVGRITGMKDCRWADPQTEAFAGAYVPLDRKYALASGLMEITYKTGAKVILQGPCTYAVESRHGGYLSLGKLTAKVQKGLGVRDQGSEEVNPNSPGPWPLTPDPFCVRTPTAIVTDLGTEFGVEVGTDGASDVRVFEGLVTVAAKSPGANEESKRLTEGESVRVERDADGDAHLVNLDGAAAGGPDRFVRRMPRVVDPRAYSKMVLADKPLFYWTFDESGGPAFEQVRHYAPHALIPLGEAERCTHASIGSGLALGRAADFSQAAGAFESGRLDRGVLPGAWAIEFWIQALGDRTDGKGKNQYVINAGIVDSTCLGQKQPAVIFNWSVNAADNELQLHGNPEGPTHGGPILADERWRHVLLVCYGDGESRGVVPRVDVVLDGRRETIDRGKYDAVFNLNGFFLLGAERENFVRAFRGRIDELAFYDLNNMTEAEIEARITDLGRRHFHAAQAERRSPVK